MTFQKQPPGTAGLGVSCRDAAFSRKSVKGGQPEGRIRRGVWVPYPHRRETADSWSFPPWQMHGIATFSPIICPTLHPPSPAFDDRTHLGIWLRVPAPAELHDGLSPHGWASIVDDHSHLLNPCTGLTRAQQPRTPVQELSLQVQRAVGVFKAFMTFNSANVYSAPSMCRVLL